MTKRIISVLLSLIMIMSMVVAFSVTASAAPKTQKRTIAIVFDNSGSMYESDRSFPDGDKAWCRATYAMEVFATMMNPEDELLVFPMHPIEIGVGGEQYSSEKPLKVNQKNASTIRNILSPMNGGTPIESIDYAYSYLKEKVSGSEKWLIVLTDGTYFHKNGVQLTDTKNELKNIFKTCIENVNVLYLGIGPALSFDEKEIDEIKSAGSSNYFEGKAAQESKNVLTELSLMCNTIFGRDSLQQKNISDSIIDFDVTMSKLILFIQGDGISNVKLGDLEPISVSSPHYSEKGTTDERYIGTHKADNSLQGSLLTFEDVPAGVYPFSFDGKQTSIDVYYEPDVDLVVKLLDKEGHEIVDVKEIVPGTYYIEYYMVDKDGNRTNSELLGNVEYYISYTIDGQEYQLPINEDGISEIVLEEGQEFEGKDFDATYLDGYTIHKTSPDFLIKKIKVNLKDAGNLKMEISDGEKSYSLVDLAKGKPFVVKIYHEGVQLTGEELKNVTLEYDAHFRKEFADDHYELWLEHDDPKNPQNTKCGKHSVTVNATYKKENCEDAKTKQSFNYTIKDEGSPLKLRLFAPDSYIVIKKIEKSRPVVAELKINGKPLVKEDFEAVKLTVECNEIKYKVTESQQDSAHYIKLLPTENLKSGSYTIKVTAEYTDHIGRVTKIDDSLMVTFGVVPPGIIWLFWILVLLLLAIIIWLWLRTPVLPKKIRITNISVRVGGREMTNLRASVIYPKKGKRRSTRIKGTGDLSDARINLILVPAKDSYRYLPSKRRKALVVHGSVKPASSVSKIEIGNESFKRNRTDNSLIRESESVKNFNFPQGQISYSGSKDINGRTTKYIITGDILFE